MSNKRKNIEEKGGLLQTIAKSIYIERFPKRKLSQEDVFIAKHATSIETLGKKPKERNTEDS